MGLSDWVGIFGIITFVGFASVVYEVATRVFDARVASKLSGPLLRPTPSLASISTRGASVRAR
jgi:hypothetical protein